jgi:hypothetical protein
VNTDTDPNNCGDCGVKCAGGRVCNLGSCVCPSDAPTVCGNSCVDLTTDPKSCGACAKVCGPNTVCAFGVCKNYPSCDQWVDLGPLKIENKCAGDFTVEIFGHMVQQTNPNSFTFGTKAEIYYKYQGYPTTWLATKAANLSFSPSVVPSYCWNGGSTGCPAYAGNFKACNASGYYPARFPGGVSITFSYWNQPPVTTRTVPSCLKP